MKKQNFKHPIVFFLIVFTALQIAGALLYSYFLMGFPELTELEYVQGRLIAPLEYSSYKGGGALNFSLQSEEGPVKGIINCHKQCLELKQLDGAIFKSAGAWFESVKISDRPNKALQLSNGSGVVWSYAITSSELKSNYREILLLLIITSAFFSALSYIAVRGELLSDESDL